MLLTGVITEDGLPRDMRVTGPLGFGLDESALQTVQQWRFLPATRAGQPVPTEQTVAVLFHLPELQSRWHLIGADFHPPEGASRPSFLKTTYPGGAGISVNALEEGWVIGAIGRQGTASIAFDVDEHGAVANARVVNSSHEIWGREALALVRGWQFQPGTRSGSPVPVPCTLDFVWGAATLDTKIVEWARTQLAEPPIVPVPALDFGQEPLSPQPVTFLVYGPDSSLYTREAQQAGLEGTVQLMANITEDGSPRLVRVTKSLGMGLDQNAVEEVVRWKFRPVLVNGAPTPARVIVEVIFQLHPTPLR